MKDLYELLEVDKKATKEEIKLAYKRLVKLFHPDLVPGKEKEFKAIKEAYNVLSDDRRRQTYDITGSTTEITEKIKIEYFKAVFDGLIVNIITESNFQTLSDVIGGLNKMTMKLKEKKKDIVNQVDMLTSFYKKIHKKKESKPQFFYENFIFKIEELQKNANELSVEIEMFDELIQEIHKNHDFFYSYQDNPSSATMLERFEGNEGRELG
jgi:curved DNA-binding protein CbpA